MVLLCALCTCINYADRVNMSVTIISMSETYSLTIWQQSVVLSSFFLGYIPMQIGGAVLCRRHGGKLILSIGALTWSVFTILTPVAGDIGLWVLVSCRICMGFAEGVAFPSIFHFLSEWVPAHERGRAVALFLTGAHVGTVVALLLAPVIIRELDWRFVFYIFGVAGFGWVAAWHLLAYDRGGQAYSLNDGDGIRNVDNACVVEAKGDVIINTEVDDNDVDADHIGRTVNKNSKSSGGSSSGGNHVSNDGETHVRVPLMSEEDDKRTETPPKNKQNEDRITSTTRSVEAAENRARNTNAQPSSFRIPGISLNEWHLICAILTDKRTLSVCAAQSIFATIHYVLLSWLPTYFKMVFNTDTGSLSFTFIPYAAMAIAANGGGHLADMLIRKGYHITNVRNGVTTVASIGAAIMLVLFTRAQSISVAIGAMSVSMAFMSIHSGGFESAYLDLASPASTGLFKATSNTIASFAGFLAIPLSTRVLKLVGGSWRLMFASLAIWHILMLVVFVGFYSAERVLTETAL